MKDRLWRHKFLVVIWVGVLGVGGYAGYLLFLKSSGNENPYVLSNSSNSQGETKAATEEAVTSAAIGEAAADGDAEFTVSGINCTESTIGANQYAMDEAEGVFCRLNVQVTNNGTETVSLPESQSVTVSEGNEYTLDVSATQYAQEDQTTGYWYEDIASGATVSGDLVFDVPAAMTPVSAMLYGSDDSAGVEVTLE